MQNFLKIFSLVSVLGLTIVSESNAASVLISNATLDGQTNAIVSSSGSLLTDTYVGVGYFSGLTDTQLQSLDAAMFSSIATGGAFEEFASSTSWWSLGAGLVEGNAEAAINSGSEFIGKAIYSIIGNAATLEDSTEFLIFKHSGTFGQDDPFFSATASINLTTGNGTLLWGDSGLFSGDYFSEGNNPAFSTAGVVPEPSRVFLFMLGVVGVMVRRRRSTTLLTGAARP